MQEDIETKKDSQLKNLIGILLIMPIYILIFIMLKYFQVDFTILFLILMYLPIIIGMVLSYKNYNNKTSKLISVCILIFLCRAIYFFYNTYFVEHSGWDGLSDMFLWLINTAILRIFSCIFYGKIVGWKKTIIFFILYILSIASSFVLGLWR